MVSMIYDLLYCMPLSVILVMIIGPYLGLIELNRPTYIASVFLSVFVAWYQYADKKLKILIPLVVTAVGAGGVLLFRSGQMPELLWKYSFVVWILIFAVFGLLLSKLICFSVWLRRLSGLVLAGVAFASCLLEIKTAKSIVALLFLLLLLFLAEEVQEHWKKSGNSDKKPHMVFIAPFLVLACGIVYFLPAPERPYDWAFAVNIWENMTENLRKTTRFLPGNSEEYGRLGFSESGSILGSFNRDGKEIMELTAGKDAGPLLYLSGKVFNKYDGRQWVMTEEQATPDVMLDTMETEVAVEKYDYKYEDDYLRKTGYFLKYQYFRTKVLFMPLKPRLEGDKVSDISFTFKDGEIVAKKKQGYGTEYRVNFNRLNKEHKVFEEFVNAASPIDKKEWRNETVRYALQKAPGYSYEDYLQYRERVKQMYYEPVNCSPEVEELLEEVFEGCESDYARLKRLELWLASMTYTNNPGKFPTKVDSPESFLDYFLLEKPEGYCVHFTTAFAMIARSMGYPTRCVQGFYVYRGNEETVMVTTDMSHSWPEVYFDHVGWVPFEPTPSPYRDVAWSLRSEEDALRAEQEDGQEKEWGGVTPFYADDSPILPSEEPVEEPKKKMGNPLPILIPIALAVLFAFGYLAIDARATIKRFEKLEPEEKIRARCRQNLYLFSVLESRPESGETLEEYGKRVGGEYSEKAKGFLNCYEELSYLREPVTEDQIETVERSFEELCNLLKERKKHKYFIYWLRSFSEKNRK